jgi:hypothetical protein
LQLVPIPSKRVAGAESWRLIDFGVGERRGAVTHYLKKRAAITEDVGDEDDGGLGLVGAREVGLEPAKL